MDSYIGFIDEIIKIIPRINTANNIVSVYLGGSVSRGDYVVGASDIDIYVVVNDYNGTALINHTIREIAKEKLPQLLSWCPDGVAVTYTTYDDIKTGKSWLASNSDYFTFQNSGTLLYGKDIKQDIVKPNERDIVKTSKQAIVQLKQIVKQDIKDVNKDRYFIRGIFGMVYSAMYFYLSLNGIYIRGKEKIVTKFCEVNPAYSETSRNIQCLWNIFCQRQLNENEINNLIKYTKIIICNI